MYLYTRNLSPNWKLFIIVVYLLAFFFLSGGLWGISKVPQYEVVIPITMNDAVKGGVVNGE